MKTETFIFQKCYDDFKTGQIIGDRKRHLVIGVDEGDTMVQVTCAKLSKKWWVKIFQVLYLKIAHAKAFHK